jgi:1A family penicillin-binding protein
MSNKKNKFMQNSSQILTQAMQTIQAKVNFQALVLKKGARVPEIWVRDARGQTSEVYPLLGEKYAIGRSSQFCDIVIRNPVISQIHCSLEREKKNSRAFSVRDENSTNGVYIGKTRIDRVRLYHGDIFTLGPPELEAAVSLKYHNPPPFWIKLIRYSLFATGGTLTLFLSWLVWEWSKIDVYPLPSGITGPVIVYARDGVTPLTPQRKNAHQEIKNLAQFSPYLSQATIASEDSRYYWHFGVDPYGILRAIVINLQGKDIRQGASTITQQLARSLFAGVGRQNTTGRKLREAIVALKLEATYSKDELLKTYLNRVYLGSGNYGFEDAAQFYFEKSATQLSISEAATLVAILPAPNSYNPVKDYDTAIGLRNRVISRMTELGYISQEEGNRARRSRIEVSDKARQTLSSTIAPYLYSHVFEELNALLGNDVAKEGNFIVETGLDLKMQKQAEESLNRSVTNNGSTYKYSQGAIVTLNTKTGEILALTGGVNYSKSQFNRATQALRQPGSTFKVFAYSAALEKGISPSQTYSCSSLTWEGQNYPGCERSSGDIDMYRAIAQSENNIALKVAREVGNNTVIAMAERLGITSQLKATPGLVLGQSEVKVLDMTGAYATFANQGIWNRPHAIKRILDAGDCQDYKRLNTCREVYSFAKDNNSQKKAISPEMASTMTVLLRGVVTGGTGKNAALGLDEVGKTGTTNDGVDLWFIGFVPSEELITSVWLGNDDNSPTRGSSAQAAILWNSYMKKIVN